MDIRVEPHQNRRAQYAHRWLMFLDNRTIPLYTNYPYTEYAVYDPVPIIS